MDQEHIDYEFQMLYVCVSNITNQTDPIGTNIFYVAGFIHARNLYNYLKKNKLFDKYNPPKPLHKEIMRLVEEQICTLTDKRTAVLEHKLTAQDMQEMYKFMFYNSKALGVSYDKITDEMRYQTYADRYMIYGDRRREKVKKKAA